jgi:hypothetical protein
MESATAPPQAPAPSQPEMKSDSMWSALAVHQVPASKVVIVSFMSYLISSIAYLQGAEAYVAFGLALVPWLGIAFVELKWTYKHFHWFAIFTFMVIVQAIHYSEHCIQVIQYHLFNDSLHESQAIFSKFNIEGVHFAGDTLLTVGTLLLIWKFPRNPWLWVAIPFQLAHQAEHTYLMFNYVFEGTKVGGPGLLGTPGGLINIDSEGGLGLVRPDLHWIYNTLYTIPFTIALVWQLKRVYDESIDEAFPDAPAQEKLAMARHLTTLHYEPGELVLAPGSDDKRLYIITEGEAGVYEDQDGQEVEVGHYHHGQYFGEQGLLVPDHPHTKIIRAKTKLSTLAMDEATFRHLMASSTKTAQEVQDVTEHGFAADAPAS